MPTDTDFTLSLFDTTALSGWSPPTRHAGTEPDAPDLDDADDTDDDVAAPPPAEPVARGSNFHLAGDRGLARGWPARARDNIAAITLSKALEQSGRAPTADEQAQLLRFIGFGATELAQNCFRRPGEAEFRAGWQEIGAALEAAVTPAEYAALQRATQYAYYTPEPVIGALWRAAERLGFTGGRVLEPGMGTGLFFALLPESLHATCQLTGIEYDPVTARIARLVHPAAQVRGEDYTRSTLSGRFDLVIGNPPFSGRVVRADPVTRSLGLLLHDYFIARSIARLPRRHRAVRHQYRYNGQSPHDSAGIHRRHGRPGGRGAPARGQHARERRHRCRDRHPVVPAPRRQRGASRRGLDRPRAGRECRGGRGSGRHGRHRRPGVSCHPGQPLLRRASGDGAGRACAPAGHLRPCPDLYLPPAQERRGAGNPAERGARPAARRHLHRVARVHG